jgi:nuclear transport factor 2 (NTF2) superfamily protein
MSRAPLPPFTLETAIEKIRVIEDNWNSREPARVALCYTIDCFWRNRVEFLSGRAAIEAFLARKWAKELDYRLIKELWAFTDNRIAAQLAYEYCDDSGSWFRAYGNENWEFDPDGLMRRCIASINEHPIAEADRMFLWPLGRRPDNHPELSHFDFQGPGVPVARRREYGNFTVRPMATGDGSDASRPLLNNANLAATRSFTESTTCGRIL